MVHNNLILSLNLGFIELFLEADNLDMFESDFDNLDMFFESDFEIVKFTLVRLRITFNMFLIL